MNRYDITCYEKTYNDSRYWEEAEPSNNTERRQTWSECRSLTDGFFNELIARGYLVPRSPNKP